MKKTILLVLACILAMTFVLAANENAGDNAASAGADKAISAKAEANQTYGQCVSTNAEVKNTCYANVKSVYSTCNDAAKNSSDAKGAKKQCSNAYKQDMAGCKKTFKDAKNECKKIKHNFLETVRYSMA